MIETIRQTWGEMLSDYPGISGLFLEAVKSGMLAGCALLMVCLLARRSALSRSWVIRMGFLALGIATVWNFVPESGKNSQPRILVEVSAPLPSTSLPSVPLADVPVAPISIGEIEHGNELPKSPDAMAGAVLQDGLDAEESPFSLKLWIEENLKLIWFGIASFIALWLTSRYLAGVFWLRRNGRPVGDQIRQLVEETTASLRLRRTVRCRLVEGLGSPLITGWWRANIWLPDHVVEMPPAHQRVIIEHELAHFRRNDFPWQTYASLMAAFWWWNPLVFLLLRKLKSEAELAADDVVVSGGASGADYAEALVKVAAGASYVPRHQIGVPMLGRSSIEKRVKEIVSENPFRNRIGWIASLMIALVAVGGGLLASFTAIAQQREERATEAGSAKSSDPDVQKHLANKLISMLEKRHEQMRFLHYKVERRWTQTDQTPDSPVTPPIPEKVEIWIDQKLGKHRVEYRPQVLGWTNGAAPFFTGDLTEINDGDFTLSIEETQPPQDPVKNSENENPQKDHACFGTEYELSAHKILSSIAHHGKTIGGFGRSVIEKELDGRKVAEIVQEFPVGGDEPVKQRETIRLDLDRDGAVVLHRFEFPQRRRFIEWSVSGMDESVEGQYYPKAYKSESSFGEDRTISNYLVTKLEVLNSLPPETVRIPNRAEDEFVAKGGDVMQPDEVRIRFSDAESGKAVPVGQATYQINRASIVTLEKVDEKGLSVPFPDEEVTFFRVTCDTPGYVDHAFTFRKGGDPLRVPETYEVKLHKASGIKGKIITEAGSPIEGALIEAYLFGGQNQSGVLKDGFRLSGVTAKSDASGNWRMEGFPSDLGDLSLRVSHPDYVDTSNGSVMDYIYLSRQKPTSLRDGTSRIILRDGVRMKGRVLDDSGKPVEGCRVTIGEDNFQNESPVAITNVTGAYEFSGLKVGEAQLTFEGPRQRPEIRKVSLPLNGEKMQEIRLKEPLVMRARVVDEDGTPCVGLSVHTDTWLGQRNLKFHTKTDKEGRFEWPAAPEEQVSFSLGWGQKSKHLFGIPLVAAEKELRIVMKPALKVNIFAVDDETGKPVNAFRVTSGYDAGSSLHWLDEYAQSVTDGKYEWVTERFAERESNQRRFRIEAEGYETLQTEAFPTNQQVEVVEVRLKKTQGR